MISFALGVEGAITHLFAGDTRHTRVPSVSHCSCSAGAAPGLELERERDRAEDAFTTDPTSNASASASASPSASASDPSNPARDCERDRESEGTRELTLVSGLETGATLGYVPRGRGGGCTWDREDREDEWGGT